MWSFLTYSPPILDQQTNNPGIELYQDSTSPFRPNVSYYEQENTRAQNWKSDHLRDAPVRSVLADEDTDFGPVYGNGRRIGVARDERDLDTHIESGDGPDFTLAHSALVG